MLVSAWRCSGVSGPSAPASISSWKPRITVIGVRSSWDAMLMNSLRIRATSSRELTYTFRCRRMSSKALARYPISSPPGTWSGSS